MEEVARCQPNGLATVHNGADDVGGHEGIADGLAHAGLWDGVFGGNLLIGFARRGRWRYCAGGCGQPILGSCRCLRCLLLVMCTYPIAKKALTLHLARGEGRERYFGCNLMQRKVLASSHQQPTAQAPGATHRDYRRLVSVNFENASRIRDFGSVRIFGHDGSGQLVGRASATHPTSTGR